MRGTALDQESMTTLTPSSEDTRIYEISVMYASDMTPKDESALLKNLESIFSEAAGKQLFKDQWSRRGLAYKIKGTKEVKFVIFYYEFDPSKTREIDHAIRLEKGVLRHLIVIPPVGYEAVSFEDKYQEWIKTRETAADMRKREQEEKTKERVTTKAKMEAKRMEAQKKRKAEKEPVTKMESGQINEELEKLISDEDLNI